MRTPFDQVCKAVELIQQARTFYDDSLKTCADKLGGEVFGLLRDQADDQIARLAAVSQAMSTHADWEAACSLPEDDVQDLRAVFQEWASGHAPAGACLTELGAARAALKVNDALVGFTEGWASGADTPTEQDFVRRLAEEQRSQRLMLADLVDYYEDPADWAMRQDNAGLDGA